VIAVRPKADSVTRRDEKQWKSVERAPMHTQEYRNEKRLLLLGMLIAFVIAALIQYWL
jgi:hypothetical protein